MKYTEPFEINVGDKIELVYYRANVVNGTVATATVVNGAETTFGLTFGNGGYAYSGLFYPYNVVTTKSITTTYTFELGGSVLTDFGFGESMTNSKVYTAVPGDVMTIELNYKGSEAQLVAATNQHAYVVFGAGAAVESTESCADIAARGTPFTFVFENVVPGAVTTGNVVAVSTINWDVDTNTP